MVGNDVLRVEQGMNIVKVDCEHPGKSIFSDSDFDSDLVSDLYSDWTSDSAAGQR